MLSNKFQGRSRTLVRSLHVDRELERMAFSVRVRHSLSESGAVTPSVHAEHATQVGVSGKTAKRAEPILAPHRVQTP
jgi:hypothetical protein